MAGRSGSPVTSVQPLDALRRVEAKVRATAWAQEAPSRLASPGRAFCSWMTTGTPAFLAAK